MSSRPKWRDLPVRSSKVHGVFCSMSQLLGGASQSPSDLRKKHREFRLAAHFSMSSGVNVVNREISPCGI